MKLQITRIYLSGIGHPDARADPLTLSFLNRTGSDPEHSLLLLRNAGGKTSLMREIFSMLHPAAVERIGREDTPGRSANLTSYVLRSDTAHVVIEWRHVEDGACVDDWTLLTGLVAEWPSGRLSKSISDLARVWYTVAGPLARASLDHLVFSEEQGGVRRRVRMAAFREQLTALTHGRGAPVVDTFDGQQRWVERLDGLGLDRVLLRYMAEMNHNEAGASAIARWKNESDFIGFFVKTAVDPAEIEGLDAEIEATAQKVHRLPALRRQLAFEEALHAELMPLATAVTACQEAETEHAEAVRGAEALVAGLDARGVGERERAAAAGARAAAEGEAAQQHASNADRFDDIAREHQKSAADFTLEEARRDDDAAAAREQNAARDVDAWALTDDLVARDDAEASLRAAQEAAHIEDQRFRPLEEARDEAAADLATGLSATAAAAENSASQARERATQATASAAEHRRGHDQVLADSIRQETDANANETRLEEVRAQRQKLVGDGALAASETAHEALAREEVRETEARARLGAIEDELGALAAERRTLTQQDQTENQTRISLERRRSQTATALAAAEAERNALAGERVVLEAAGEAEAVDLEATGGAIIERLEDRARSNDQRAHHQDLDSAAERRSLDGLIEHRLLPPPLEVELALDALARSGITSARAATRYAAEAMREDERGAATLARPDLLAGIVLRREDLARAGRILERSELTRTVPLVVGPPEELYSAPAPANASVVLPPSAAAWDPDAAEAERARLAERIDAVDAERDQLLADARAVREIGARLRAHLERFPRLNDQRALVASFAAELERLQQASDVRNARSREIVGREQDLRREQRTWQDSAFLAAARRPSLAALAEAEAKTVGLQAKIDAAHEEARRLREFAAQLQSEEDAARSEAERSRRAAHDHDRLAQELRDELARLGVPGESRPAGPAFDLGELRARYGAIDSRLRREVSASEVYSRREQQRERLAAVRERISRKREDIRARAEELRTLPEAATLGARRAALGRAEEEHTQAREAARKTNGALTLADRAAREIAEIIERARRPVRLRDEERPRDRIAALRYEAEARRRSEEEKAQAEAARSERANAEREEREAEDVLKIVARWAEQILTTLGTHEAPTATAPSAPTPGPADAIETLARAVHERLATADKRVRAAERAWQECDDAVAQVASRPEFAPLAQANNAMFELARSQTRADRAHSIDELLIETQNFIATARLEIASEEQDINLATISLAKTVGNALSELRSAERSSRLPATLHGWSGEPFLRVRFTAGNPEDLRTRLWPFVNEMVNSERRLVGEVLLLKALERAVGSFRVEILKPNEAFTLTYVPITELPSFSGGQRATVAIALMLMFSALRQRSRASTRDASLGALILDNPLGNASAGFLIDVQIAVASAAGIQLIYLSGIQDLLAIRRFPNFIALANSAAQRSDWRYIRTDELLRDRLRPAEEAGGQLSAARIVVAASR